MADSGIVAPLRRADVCVTTHPRAGIAATVHTNRTNLAPPPRESKTGTAERAHVSTASHLAGDRGAVR